MFRLLWGGCVSLMNLINGVTMNMIITYELIITMQATNKELVYAKPSSIPPTPITPTITTPIVSTTTPPPIVEVQITDHVISIKESTTRKTVPDDML